jgi:hypothetical protein
MLDLPSVGIDIRREEAAGRIGAIKVSPLQYPKSVNFAPARIAASSCASIRTLPTVKM